MKVTLDNVTKRFDTTVAVSEFSAELQDGHLICLLGPSGCGKSTILNMLSGILPVTDGRIFFDDKDVTALPPNERGIGMVFQNYALYPHLTVLKNICFPLEVQKVPKAERIERATEMAKLVHVEDQLSKYPSELSGGQQQRVAIARALVKNPKLLLMDEPLSNLDARLRLEMREEIRRIQLETGVTTVFVTHDQEEAMSISDNILLMKSGVLQQAGLPQELYNEPANRFVADFLGTPPINTMDGVWKNGAFELLDGSAGLKLAADIEEGRNVTFAARAEGFDLIDHEDEVAEMDCVLESLSLIGKDEIAYVRFGSALFRAFINADHTLKAGDRFQFRLRKRGAFLFDTETGARLK